MTVYQINAQVMRRKRLERPRQRYRRKRRWVTLRRVLCWHRWRDIGTPQWDLTEWYSVCHCYKCGKVRRRPVR